MRAKTLPPKLFDVVDVQLKTDLQKSFLHQRVHPISRFPHHCVPPIMAFPPLRSESELPRKRDPNRDQSGPRLYPSTVVPNPLLKRNRVPVEDHTHCTCTRSYIPTLQNNRCGLLSPNIAKGANTVKLKCQIRSCHRRSSEYCMPCMAEGPVPFMRGGSVRGGSLEFDAK